MRATIKVILGVLAVFAVVLIAFGLYARGRGGHYAVVTVASFSNLPSSVASGAISAEAVVQIDSGSLRGARVGQAIAFRGIPYARPPVGELRWQPPRPAESWSGVRDASLPGSACTQRDSGLGPFFSPMAKAYGSSFDQPVVRSSEDCLYLDVWTAQWPVKTALPVMVWLHGGSNTVGSGTQSTYDGAALAAHGIVLVTLNYRLGVMGFFSHPELTAESPQHSSGNYGSLDQVAALEWVKRNIAQFGGDPGNVTLFGESAGAIDAGRLMSSPLASGLFRRVISESGPAFEPSRALADAEAFGTSVSALAPVDQNLTPLQRLRALPAAQVEKLVAAARQRAPVDITSATTDGWLLPQSPQKAFLSGSIQKVDLLVGLNARELSAFRLAAKASSSGDPSGVASAGGLKKFSDAAHPYFGSSTYAAMAMYLADIILHRDAGIDRSANDLIGACPIGAMANLTEAAGQRVFVYRFERVVPGKGAAELGAFHSLEVPFVFGSLHDREWKWLPATAEDEALSGLLQTYWTNFAKTGDPNASGLPSWPVWSARQQEFLVINQDATVSAQKNFKPLFSRLSAPELKESFKNR